MRYVSITFISYSQLFLFGWLFIAYLLNPSFFEGSGGLSNYGVFWPTIIPYTLAFGLGAICVALAAYTMPKRTYDHHVLAQALAVLAVALVLALISSYLYHHTTLLEEIHKITGFILLLYQLVFGGWLVVHATFDYRGMALFVAQTIGFMIVVASFLTPAVFLSQGQVLSSLFFAVLLVRGSHRLLRS